MLTSKDIDKLLEVFPTKNEIQEIIREQLEPFRKEVLTGLDKVVTVIETQNLEDAARDAQLSRHDEWIHRIAKKTKVPLSD